MSSQPIAIIGMACTFAGARNIAQYWQNIMGKVDAITEMSPNKLNAETFYHPDPSAPDRIYCKRGGWLDDSFVFNPLSYGITPSSVNGAEPDQFLVLRTVSEALEDAGYGREEAHVSRAGLILGKGNYMGPSTTSLLYRGVITQEILQILQRVSPELTDEQRAKIKESLRAHLPELNAENAAALIPNMATGRTANRLDFTGRNFTVDAACASSLIATELGVQSLVAGQEDLMVVGGIHTVAHFTFLQVFAAMRALSTTGMIRPFDEECDGTIPGEGIGLLVLKRLADAERDRDRIYAVLKGVGTSSDGRAKGIATPRLDGELVAFRRAYQSAGLDPQTVSLLECHGTGTPVGDATEIEALRHLYRHDADGQSFCAIGSVKSMIGHTMPAAGAAGMIKSALALYHRILPPTLNCKTPHSALRNSPFYVNSETRPWVNSLSGPPRRAGVSAFGFGGINGHVVLEEYAGNEGCQTLIRDWESEVVILESASRSGLARAAERLEEYLKQTSGVALRDVAYTLNTSMQGAFECLSIVASSCEDLVKKLGYAKSRLTDPSCRQIEGQHGVFYFGEELVYRNNLAVFFPGQGCQYPNMLKDLCLHFSEVRESFDLADSMKKDSGRVPTSRIIFPPPIPDTDQSNDERLWTLDRAGEAVLAADIGIFNLLSSLHLRPNFVVGHSLGELAGLTVSGVLDQQEMLASTEHFASIFNDLASSENFPTMSMLAVGAGAAVVESLVAKIDVTAFLANDNCSQQVVVVVRPEEESRVSKLFRENGIFVNRLPYNWAAHTPLFSAIAEPLREFFSTRAISPPQIRLYSCSTAAEYPESKAAVVEHLSQVFIRPLYFRQTVESLYEAGVRIFVESGPRGTLSTFVDDILRGKPHLAVPIDQYQRPGLTVFNRAIALLMAARVPLKPNRLYERRSVRRLSFDPLVDRQLREDEVPGAVRISTCYPRFGIPDLAQQTVFADDISGDLEIQSPGEMISKSGGVMNDHFSLMTGFLEVHETVMQGVFRRGRCQEPETDPAKEHGHPVEPRMDPPSLGPNKMSCSRESYGGHAAKKRDEAPEIDIAISEKPLIRFGTLESFVDGESITIRCQVNADDYPYLEDHCIHSHAMKGKEAGSPLLSIPMTGSLEMMVEAAALLRPSLRVIGVNDMRSLRWANIEKESKGITLVISAKSAGRDHVSVIIQQPADPSHRFPTTLAEATIAFSEQVPEPAKERRPGDFDYSLRDEHEPVCRGQDVYTAHQMFHGPCFQGLRTIQKIGENGLTGTLEVLPNDKAIKSDAKPRFHIDPFLLDAAGQLVGYWPTEYLREGFVVLPIQIDELTLHGEGLSSGEEVRCNVRINEVTPRQLSADLDLFDGDGNIWLQITGWKDWRFYWSQESYDFSRFPHLEANGKKIDIAPGIECRRVDVLNETDKTNLWEELWMRSVLSRNEIQTFQKIRDRAVRTHFLLKKAAIKDALRMWLKSRGGLALYPNDLDLDEDEAGLLIVEGNWGADLPSRLYVAVCNNDQFGLAAVSRQRIVIALQSPDQMTVQIGNDPQMIVPVTF
jgi:acyl transferase domain-containing protein